MAYKEGAPGKKLIVTLVDALKTHYIQYCGHKQGFCVSRDRERVPLVILEKSSVCNEVTCTRHDTCLTIALGERLKGDLLKLHRQRQRVRALEKSLLNYEHTGEKENE